MNVFIHGSTTPLSPIRPVGVVSPKKSLNEHELPEHAQDWINKIKPECELALKELADGLENTEPIILTHCPVRFLREVREDGSGMFLGDVGLVRCRDILLENPKHDNTTNLALPIGHPDIIWTIGGILFPVACEFVRFIRRHRFSHSQSSSEGYNDRRSWHLDQ